MAESSGITDRQPLCDNYRTFCFKHGTDYELSARDWHEIEDDQSTIPSPYWPLRDACDGCQNALLEYWERLQDCGPCNQAKLRYDSLVHTCDAFTTDGAIHLREDRICPECRCAKREYGRCVDACAACQDARYDYWGKVKVCLVCKEKREIYRSQVATCSDCRRAREAATAWRDLADKSSMHIALDSKALDVPDGGLLSRVELSRWDVLKVLLGAKHYVELSHSEAENQVVKKGPGPRPKDEIDDALRGFTLLFLRQYGLAQVSIANSSDAKPHKPAAHFIFSIRSHLPPSFRLQSQQRLAVRAREVLRRPRNRSSSRSRSDECQQVHLEVVTGIRIGGHPPGEIFSVAAKDGLPRSWYWRNQLKRGAVALLSNK